MHVATANPDGTGNWAILDLPFLDPVFVDLDKPLEDQLPPGPVLEAARKLLAEAK
jgi:hypothetical protein